jgi:hypothetical protein
MKSRNAIRLLLTGLTASLAATGARAGSRDPTFELTPRLERQLEFARHLCARRWFDIAESVVQRVEKFTLAGYEKPLLYKELGEFYGDVATQAARGRGGLTDFIRYLDVASGYYRKFLDDPVTKKYVDPKGTMAGRSWWVGQAAEIRTRLSWISMSTAEAHAQLLDDPQVPAEDKAKHKAEAARILKAAIGDLRQAVDASNRSVEDIRKKEPPRSDRAGHQRWERQYQEAKAESFRVRLYINEARLRYARFLRKTKADRKEWLGELQAAEKDLIELRKKFSGTPGGKQANLNIAICMYEQGPSRDEDALGRLVDLWNERRGFDKRRLPCEAAFWQGRIRFRQKNYPEAIKILHALLEYRSGGAWKADVVTSNVVQQFLADNEDAAAEDYDQKALAGAFMLLARAYAGLADKGAASKADPRKVREYYGLAYDIASAVDQVQRTADPKLIANLELWRKKSGKLRSLGDLQRLYVKALLDARNTRDPKLRKEKYLEAASFLSELLSRAEEEPEFRTDAETKRRSWFLVGQCYYFAGRFYEAYIVFTGYTRWFPEPKGEQLKAGGFARAAVKKLLDQEKSPFHVALSRRALAHDEMLRYGGGSWQAIRQGIDLRNAGRYDDALYELRKVAADNEAFPHALYHTGLTHKARYQKLDANAQKSPAGRRELAAMADAFGKVLAEYAQRIPKLQDEEDAEKRDRLVDIVAATLTQLVGAHYRGLLPNGTQVLELTDDLETRYPGIGKTDYAAQLLYYRMAGAYSLIDKADPEQAARLAAVIEEGWKAIQNYKEFEHLDGACNLCAQLYLKIAKRIREEEVPKATDAEKPALLQQAKEADARSLDFYLQLFEKAPQQKLATYYYVVHAFRQRGEIADFRQIIKVASQAIELYDGQATDPADRKTLLILKGTLGIAYAKAEKYSQAIEVLEAVNAVYDQEYEDRLKAWEAKKARHEENPRRFPKPPGKPVRSQTHSEFREWLARCYLLAESRDKYAKAVAIYVEFADDARRDEERYLEVIYWLCEAYRRQGDLESAVLRLFRAISSRAQAARGEAFAERYRALVARVGQDAAKLADSSVKRRLLETLQDIAELLKP